MIRPTPERKATANSEQRGFTNNDLVFMKIYSRNGWKWVPGEVLNKCGNVMYRIKTHDRRVILSHLNQLRRRTANQHRISSESRPLALDVLLDEWKISPSSSLLIPASSSSAPAATLVSPSSTSPIVPPSASSSGPRMSAMSSSSQPSASKLPDDSPTNQQSLEAPEDPQRSSANIPQLDLVAPRRSYRSIRVPRRFDDYQLS